MDQLVWKGLEIKGAGCGFDVKNRSKLRHGGTWKIRVWITRELLWTGGQAKWKDSKDSRENDWRGRWLECHEKVENSLWQRGS
jgi:hypothetical protein